MADSTAARTSPAAAATARDVFIPSPKNARGTPSDRGAAYTMDRKRLFRRGLRTEGTGSFFETTRFSRSCISPSGLGEPTPGLSGAQGVVQFSNQALHTGSGVRGIALPTFFR